MLERRAEDAQASDFGLKKQLKAVVRLPDPRDRARSGGGFVLSPRGHLRILDSTAKTVARPEWLWPQPKLRPPWSPWSRGGITQLACNHTLAHRPCLGSNAWRSLGCLDDVKISTSFGSGSTPLSPWSFNIDLKSCSPSSASSRSP